MSHKQEARCKYCAVAVLYFKDELRKIMQSMILFIFGFISLPLKIFPEKAAFFIHIYKQWNCTAIFSVNFYYSTLIFLSSLTAISSFTPMTNKH